MHEFAKKAFRLVARIGPRHVKMNGTPWHAKGMSAHFTTSVKAAVIALAGTAAYDYTQNNDVISTLQNLVWPAAWTALGTIQMGILRGTCELTFSREYNPNIYQHAIDRQGRDFPPQNVLALEHQTKWIFILYGAIGAGTAAATAKVFNQSLDGTRESATALYYFLPQVAESASMAFRSALLLTGVYGFSDKPPHEPQRARSTSSAGQAQHRLT